MTFKKSPAIIKSVRKAAHNGADYERLVAMLETKRPHGDESEQSFVAEHIATIPGIQSDEYGNYFLRIEGQGDSILWSSHTDSVHRGGGVQSIRIDGDFIRLSKKSKSTCLGADDAAGVWLMLEMIRAGKPGFYIFHRGEEYGGLGSGFIADETPILLDGIKAAIALDRRGYDSIVTRQGDFCASDNFAKSLASAIGIDSLKPDNTGMFTDTAQYTHLIGECSNLSVGYFDQHRNKESLDVKFLFTLRTALLAMDTESLIFERQPGESDYDFDRIDSVDFIRYGRYESGYDIGEKAARNVYDMTGYSRQERDEIANLLYNKPDDCARALQEMGITIDTLNQWVYDIDSDDDIPF